jgi:hypothetical protein
MASAVKGNFFQNRGKEQPSMPDEERTIESIDWRKVLPFIHLFRAFRISIHPSKLFIGLLLLLSLFVGGKALDHFWPGRDKAVDGEVALYENADSLTAFQWQRAAALPASFGVFHTFFYYEVNQINGIANSVIANDWFMSADSSGPTSVSRCIYRLAVIGPGWLFRGHPLFGALFAILLLCDWSLFGGAIARLAAVNVARDEKVSIRQALNFSLGKFFSFASAPIIPMLIVCVVGLLISIGSLLGNLPYLGPLVIGVFFFLALLGGFVQTIWVLGTLGGFTLMYATIAVEGSDSFDAVSRSFSYVYSRPWRMLFYTTVSIGYGAITYLFVRLFIFVSLQLAHHFVSIGMFAETARHVGLFPTMWPSPLSTGRLTYSVDYTNLNWAARLGAYCLGFWICLFVGLLGAYVISFYFTANTIIYLLIRKDLDATEMDEVYLEQKEEEFVGGPGPEGEGTVTVVAETTILTEESVSPPATENTPT